MKKTREALWFPALQYFILLTALGIEINVGGTKKATPEVQVYFTTTPPKAGENFLRPLQQKRLHPRANISVGFRNFSRISLKPPTSIPLLRVCAGLMVVYMAWGYYLISFCCFLIAIFTGFYFISALFFF